MKLLSSGPRTESIWLFLDDGTRETLGLKAIGDRHDTILCTHQAVMVSPDEPRLITISMLREWQIADRPGTPEIQAPDGLRSSSGEWRLVYAGNQSLGRGHRWEFTFEIEAVAPLPASDVVRISLADQVFKVRLDGWGWSTY